jgi:adenylate cyclase
MFKGPRALIEWARQRPYQIFAPLVALLVVLVFEQTQLAELLENTTINLRFRARAPYDPPADPRLVFVGVDQQSLDYLGAWPWPRTQIASFLGIIGDSRVNPRVVAFDVLFSDDYDKFHDLLPKSGGNFDDVLADAAELLPCVITGALSLAPQNIGADKADADKTKLELTKPSLTVPFTHIQGDFRKIEGSDIATFPVAPLRSVSLFGFANDATTSSDGIRRTVPILVRVQDKVFPSLSLQILCQMLSVDPDQVQIHVGHDVTFTDISGKVWTIPIDEKGQYVVNYRRNESFQTLSCYWLFRNLKEYERGQPLPKECDINKKVIFIGHAAVGLSDMGPNPYIGRSPLAYVHLDVIDNVLHHDYLTFVPWPWVVIGWCLITWGTLFRLAQAPLVEAVALPILIVVFYVVIAFAIFAYWSIQVAMAWPVLSYSVVSSGAIVLRWRDEQRGRKELRQIFSRMLSPDLMNHLLENPSNLRLGGSKRAVTILFSDIRDYTSFSEGLDEEELVRQLNEYFERMVNCVLECGGRVDKFIGDAVMAMWGDLAVLSRGKEQDAKSAVRAALRMRRELKALNDERTKTGLVPLRIGIGLNHGQVVAGQIGSSTKSEFTAMGDAVNVASRLEGLTKEFHTDLAIGESVHALVGNDFLTRRLGYVQLKGKTTPTLVYEVLAERTDLSASSIKEEMVARYEKAFDLFLDRYFTEAEVEFAACEALHPGDYCVARYREAARTFIHTPPPMNWDGRVVMETK